MKRITQHHHGHLRQHRHHDHHTQRVRSLVDNTRSLQSLTIQLRSSSRAPLRTYHHQQFSHHQLSALSTTPRSISLPRQPRSSFLLLTPRYFSVNNNNNNSNNNNKKSELNLITRLQERVQRLKQQVAQLKQHKNHNNNDNNNNHNNNNNNNNNDTRQQSDTAESSQELAKKSASPFGFIAAWMAASAGFAWVIAFAARYIGFLGTTSLVSILIFIMHMINIEDYVVYKLCNFITQQANLKITFKSMKPLWSEGCIALSDIEITNIDPSLPNQTIINLKINRLDIQLSLEWLMKGNGIIKSAAVKGVRGFIDTRIEQLPFSLETNTAEAESPNYIIEEDDYSISPLSVLKQWMVPHVEAAEVNNNKTITETQVIVPQSAPVRPSGLLTLNKLEIEDVNLSLHSQHISRPLSITIFSAAFSRLRDTYLLMDIFFADQITGRLDNTLFALVTVKTDSDTLKTRTFDLKGLEVDLVTKSASGPLSWLSRGLIDVSAVLHLNNGEPFIQPKQITESRKDHLVMTSEQASSGVNLNRLLNQEKGDEIVLNVELAINNLSASIPYLTNDISYLQNALSRPIVAYLNANYTKIPFAFTAAMYQRDFHDAWLPKETPLFDIISKAVELELTNTVVEVKKKGLTSFVLMALDGVKRGVLHYVDYVWNYSYYFHV